MSGKDLLQRILQETASDIVVAGGDGSLPWVRVAPAHLERALRILEERGAVKTVCGLIGRDTGQEIELSYLLRRDDGAVEALRAHLPRHAAKAPALHGKWPALEQHQRELAELLGVEFEGYDGGRFLLPEEWVGHPLRKDYVFPESYRGVEHRRAPLRKEHQRP
jgi:NADH-quinone oxidoreductase subunit C